MTAPQVLEGRIARKLNNALTMAFVDGPGEPIGVAVQGGGAEGMGKKVAVLFGFKNGGAGTHRYAPRLGQALRIESREQEPTVLTRDDGTPVGSIHRGDVSSGVDATGREILRWIDDPGGGKTLEAFRLHVQRPDGQQVAQLHLVRTVAGWSLGRDIVDATIWWGHAGRPLPIPFLGTSVQRLVPLTLDEHEMLVASCVDMAIGLRPYSAAMR